MTATATLRKIVKAAWTIARDGAAKFGGSPRSYLREAFRAAWVWARKALVEKVAEVPGVIVRETDKAICLAATVCYGHSTLTVDAKMWFPRRFVTRTADGIVVPRWLADEKLSDLRRAGTTPFFTI